MFRAGLRTLIGREIRRAAIRWQEFLLTPAITAGLYLLALDLAGLDPRLAAERAAPGLILLTAAHYAFLFPVSAIMHGKFNGALVDLLMAPLAGWEVATGYVLSATLNALWVGLLAGLGVLVWIETAPASPLAALWVLAGCAACFAAVGLRCALPARRWEEVAFVAVMGVEPLCLLSGAFFDPARLPAPWATLLAANPVAWAQAGLLAAWRGEALPLASWALPVLALAITAETARGLARGRWVRS